MVPIESFLYGNVNGVRKMDMPLDGVVKNVDTVKKLAIRAVKKPCKYKEIQGRNFNLILARELLEKYRGAGYGISKVLKKRE